jgi:hypothetical protein
MSYFVRSKDDAPKAIAFAKTRNGYHAFFTEDDYLLFRCAQLAVSNRKPNLENLDD